MTLHINGEARDLSDGLTLASLIEQLGMKADRVAVELNLEIVSRATWDATHLKDGDKLEIVHFVGGGSGTGSLIAATSENEPRTGSAGHATLGMLELYRMILFLTALYTA